MRYWQEYCKAAYDLVLESEGMSHTFLQHEVEAYIVHLFARNFNRTDIGTQPIALQILEAKRHKKFEPIADECLLINSFPLKRMKWPSETYYLELGITAYSMANNDSMSENFEPASKVLHTIFKRIG